MAEKKLKVMGKEYPYVGNPSQKMLDEMTTVIEDLQMGKTTIEKMAAEFAAQEKKKVQ